MLGKVKFFNVDKGFGFISSGESPNTLKDYFFHHSEIQGVANADGRKSVVKGQAIEFTPVTTPKGLKATKLFPK